MKFLGLISVLFYWSVLLIIFKRWGVRQNITVSDHVVAGSSKRLYTPVALISLALFYYFLAGYFIDEIGLGIAGYILSTTALTGQIMALVYVRKSPYVLLHDSAATLTGSSAFLMLLLVLFSNHLSNILQILTASLLVFMAATGVILLNRNKPYYLYYQVFFYGCFHVAILAATFL